MWRATMIALLALNALVLAGSPAPAGWDALPFLPAPLGRLGDAIADVPAGGVPAGEKVVVARYEGCDRERAVFLNRFLAGAALGGNQIQSWLATNGKEAAVFKDRLALGKALDRAREGLFVEGQRCQSAPKDGWKLELQSLPRALCAKERKGGTGEFWFAKPGMTKGKDLTAVVRLAPAGPAVEDRCRLRASAALFDDKGKARLLFHADYGAALEVELRGDGCSVAFVFDSAIQGFRARPLKGCR